MALGQSNQTLTSYTWEPPLSGISSEWSVDQMITPRARLTHTDMHIPRQTPSHHSYTPGLRICDLCGITSEIDNWGNTGCPGEFIWSLRQSLPPTHRKRKTWSHLMDTNPGTSLTWFWVEISFRRPGRKWTCVYMCITNMRWQMPLCVCHTHTHIHVLVYIGTLGKISGKHTLWRVGWKQGQDPLYFLYPILDSAIRECHWRG